MNALISEFLGLHLQRKDRYCLIEGAIRQPATENQTLIGVVTTSAASVVLLGFLQSASPAYAFEYKQCWSESELRVQHGEAKVQRGLFAFREPPADVEITPEMRIKSQYRKAIRRFRILNAEKVVALTFDIGEQPHEISGYQGRIVDHLRSEGVRATLFLGGKWMLTHPQRAQQLMADPLFEVANHGWEHRNLRLLDSADQKRAVLRTQSAYQQQWRALKQRRCRFSPKGPLVHENVPPKMNLFRFPFGACRANSLAHVGDAGFMSVQWDISSSDPWRGQTASRMIKTVVPRVKPGSIVLFHANGRGWNTDAAIPEIVHQLRKRGFRFVTIGDLLEMSKRGEAAPVLTETCYDTRPGDTNRYDPLSRALHRKYERFLKRARSIANADGLSRSTPRNINLRVTPGRGARDVQPRNTSKVGHH